MRIAIVNDSPTATAAMVRVVSSTHEIAWTAHTGREAVECCAEDRPELILMDLFMPELDGIEATRQIMAATPCAILVVTATVDGRADKVFQALGAGALDAVATPTIGVDGSAAGAAALLSKIDMLRRLIQGGFERLRPSLETPCADRLVVFGASAGGPAALAEILGNLPPDFGAAIVIVQHIDAEFAPLMASWLNQQSKIPVQLAKQGDRPRPGVALMAATSDHLVLASGCTLCYSREPEAGSYRPSVDVFFRSVGQHWKGGVTAVLLTGMGRDGAVGLRTLREQGALTIAQDRQSCVVYGMPKAAAEIDAASEVLSLEKIASRLSTRSASRRS